MLGDTHMEKLFRILALSAGLLAAPAAVADVIVSAPIDVVGNVSLTDFNSHNYGGQTYKDWGNEPFVAVNPLNTNQIIVSSFAFGTSSTTSGASIFYSTNAGASWTTDAPFRETEEMIAICRKQGILAVEIEAAALYALASAKQYGIVCFAHVTNQMGQTEGEFEIGEAQGAQTSLDIICQTAHSWRQRRL